MSRNSSGNIVKRIGLAVIIGATSLAIAGAGVNAAGFDFVDSAKEFFGIQPTLARAANMAPSSPNSARVAAKQFASLRKEESMFAPLLEPSAPMEMFAANAISVLGVTYTEDFAGMGTSAVATLPTDFKIGTDWASGTTATTVAYGSTGTGAVAGGSAGGTVNWANGVTGSATDRALGFLTNTGFASPRSVILRVTNGTTATITALDVAFDYEKYRSGTTLTNLTFFHGGTTTAATSASAGNQLYADDANSTTVINPPTTISKSFTLTGLSIAPGGFYYLRWTYTSANNANAQGIGIDNVAITASAASNTFTTAGASAWTVPTGVTSITVETWGGGGAGGGSTTATGLTARGGAGGGGGAYASSVLSVIPGAGYQVVVAGTKAGTTGANGTAGDPSFFDVDATPAGALVLAAGGSGGAVNTGNSPAGGPGGTVAASTGTIRNTGTTGSNGATAALAASGAGGAGASPGGGAGGAALTSGESGGQAGTAPGGGGGGARTSVLQDNDPRVGGTGAAGRVVITYTVSPPVAPTLTTPTATAIDATSATLGANITADGGASLTARGTCWNTTTPVVDVDVVGNNCVAAGGTATGIFTQARTALPAGTKVYYKGYATNSVGTGYSPEGSFYTEPTTQASGVNFTAVTSSTMNVNWMRGSGDGVIVLARPVSAVTGVPADGTYSAYVANTNPASGTAIGDAHVVYKGTGTSVGLTGLIAGATYHVAVFEFKGTVDTSGVDHGTNYKLTPATGSQASLATYSVTYDDNASSGGTAPVDGSSPYEVGSVVGVLGHGTLFKAGFDFTGWNTAADGSGTHYFPAQTFIINANTTLYAQWTAPSCLPGSPDIAFNSGGKITTDVQTTIDAGRDVAIQADGKIVVAGTATAGGNSDFAVVRYNADGSLDAAFSGDGKTTTAIGGGNDVAHSIGIQADGRIVVAGSSFNGSNEDFAVVRYNTDGSLDTTFDTDGKATYALLAGDDIANSLAIQPDGKIIVVGSSSNGTNIDFAIIRLNTNGSLDTSFNVTGISTRAILAADDYATSVALQTDGRIVVAGYSENLTDSDFAAIRLLTDGSLDPSFDLDGRATYDIQTGDDYAYSIAIQGDGKIVVAGYSQLLADTDFAAIRLHIDGSTDNSFDADGKVTVNVRNPADTGRAVAIQADGKIIIVGYTNDGSNDDFGVVRLLTNGSLDPSFDGDGKVATAIGTGSDQAHSVAIQKDGKIVVVGNSSTGPGDDLAVVRYGSACAPEIDVQGNGVSIPDGDNPPSAADHTDFGFAAPGTGSVVRTFTIYNTGTAGLSVSNPTITGTNFLDFTVTSLPSSPISSPGSTTFEITFVPGGVGLRTATVNIINGDPDENPYSFAIQGTGVAPFAGAYSVSSGDTYTSLTNPDGIFAALNAGGLSGDVTVNLTGDLTAETGEVALRHLTETPAGNYRVLIKPSAGPRVVSGSFAGSLVRLDGADRVTIDGWAGATIGSAAGGAATRDLTITNTAAVSQSVLSIINTNSNPAQDNRFQNANVVGVITENSGIIIGTQSGIVIGGTAPGPDNDNNHILSCSIKKAKYGINTSGASSGNPNTGTRIERNILNATGTDRIIQVGIAVQNESGIQIVGNDIGNLFTDGAPGTVSGIAVGISDLDEYDADSTFATGVTGAFISANKVNGAVSTSNYTAAGIALAAGSGTTNTIVNNMITGVRSDATSPDIVAGIFLDGAVTSSTKVYHNSVAMTGDRGDDSGTPSFALAIRGIDPAVELKNNIFYTTQTAFGGGPQALSFAVGLSSSTYANLDSNYNAFRSSGLENRGFRTGGLLAGSDHLTLSAWQDQTGVDLDSEEIDPLFVNPGSDLHLQLTSPIANAGTPIATVLLDFDGDIRSATAPAIGADEFGGTPEISVEDHNSTVLTDGVSIVDLGTENVGVPGLAKTFTIRNLGTNFLSVDTTIAVTGTHASDFVVNNTGLSPIVGPGGSTTFTVTFTPGGPGLRTAGLSITNGDTDEDPFNFTIEGTGDIPSYTVTYGGNTSDGGTPPLDTSSPYAAGATVTVLGNTGGLFKVGFAFNGWNTAANGTGSQYAPAATFTINENTILYAQWVAPQTRYVATTGNNAGPNNCLVAGTPCLTVAYAISVANPGDTIMIAAGTYTELGLIVNKDLIFNGAGAATTFIEANAAPNVAADRVFTINSGITASMTGLTIRNGKAPAGTTGSDCTSFPCLPASSGGIGEAGGGILNDGTLTLTNMTLSENRAGKGGTAGNITCSAGSCTNIGGEGGTGGGVYSTGSLTVVSSTFTNNHAGEPGNAAATVSCGSCTSNPGDTGNGGGLSGRTVSVDSSTFTGNSGDDGGAILQGDAALTITKSTFNGNSASNSGSAINCNGVVLGCTISESSIYDNFTSGTQGGTVALFGLSVKNISNTTITGNESLGDGGGILANSGTVNLTFVTIADNIADGNNNGSGNGGGIHNEVATVNLRNSIIADNSDDGGEAHQIFGAITSLGYNHIESTTGGTFTPTTGDVIGSEDGLAPLANNGGPTQTRGLYANSPALDQIPNGTNGCGTAPFDVDQRGAGFPRPVNSACDKGAFEGSLGTAEQEIDVQGGTPLVPIPDGNTTPSAADGTDFGTAAVTGGTVVHTFTIFNTGTGSLAVSNPVITGANPLDFSITALSPPSPVVGPTGSTTFQITFDPITSGLRTATVTIVSTDGNENPYDFAIQGTGNISLSGVINVGDGQVLTSLTNADGLFEALNNSEISGDLTVNITSDLLAETGDVSLQHLTETGAGNWSILIKPSGAPRTISGSSVGSLVNLDGADRVTIDGWTGATIGSLPGGAATRDLTITNVAPVVSQSVVSIINTAANPSQGNTIQNVNVVGTSATQSGVVIGGTTPGADNDDNHILSCSIKNVNTGIYTSGADTSNPNTGTRIELNELNAAGTDRIRFIGISVQNESGVQILRNNIGNIDAGSTTGVVLGIGVGVFNETQFNVNATAGGGVVGALVSENKIAGVSSETTFSAGGIAVAGGAGENTIVNNMISGVKSAASPPDIVSGIFVAGAAGSTTKIYNNSVAMTGNRGSLSLSPSFGLAITGSDPVVEVKNNIFYTTQTATPGGVNALSFAIGTGSPTSANLDSNYNAFFSSGLQDGGFRSNGLIVGPVDYATLAEWQTAVSDDANSLEVDPNFVNPLSDPHLQLGSPVSNAATPLASVTTDIDAEARSATTPDIGADEIVGTPHILVRDHNSNILVDDISTVDLGTQTVAVSGTAKTFTIQNVGTDPLGVTTPFSVTGTNPGDFNVDTTSTSSSVEIGGSTTFTVTFTPGAQGPRSAVVSIANTGPGDENPLTFSLQGAGADLPAVSSPTATALTDTAATLGANVTSDGGVSLTERGTCWNTTSPVVNVLEAGNNCAAEGATTTGVFTHSRTPLPAGTRIFYKGYATNSVGTSYSAEGSFYTEPATQASSVNFTAVTISSMTVNWTRGSGDGVIVLAKTGSAVVGPPVDGTYTTYIADPNPANGTLINDARVVYKGTDTSVGLTGLTAGETYHVAVYEFAGAIDTAGVDQGTNYKLVPAAGSQLAAQVPSVTLPTATLITDTTATLGATLTSDNAAAITSRGTCWDITPNPATNCVAEGNTLVSLFTQPRIGLTAGTKLYYRGYATNSVGTGYSPDGSFYTEPATQASVVTFTAVTGTTMNVNWTRGSGDGVIVLARTVSAVTGTPADGTYTAYSANTDPALGTVIGDSRVVYIGTGTTVGLTNLTAGQTYHIAVFEFTGAVDTAGVNQGTNYKPVPAAGNQTAVVAPTVTTQAVSSIGTTTATGNGTITSLGAPDPTQHGVVWGTAPNPDVSLLTKTTQGPASATGAFTSSITGLTPNTVYHVRAYATNDAGTSYGDDVTFTSDSVLAITAPESITFPNTGTIVAAGGLSGGALSYAYVSGGCSVVPATGLITITDASDTPCIVNATRAAGGVYVAQTSANFNVALVMADAVITFDPPPAPVHPGADFTVNATTTNTESSALTYAYVSGPCSQVSPGGATFSPTGVGNCVVSASGAATNNFNAAGPINQTVPIVAASYNVTYDGNTNDGGTAPVDAGNPHVVGSLVGVLGPGDLTKAGYQFTGWNTAADGSGTDHFPAQAFLATADVTLHAQWTAPPCNPGGLDPSFGTDGKLVTDVQGGNDLARSVAIQPDGKIVAAGFAHTGTNNDFAAVRYNADGTPDNTFDGDGKATIPVLGFDDFANSVALQPDGKIVLAGSSGNGSNNDFAVVRLNADGSPDASFGTGGKFTIAIGTASDNANSVAVQPDGKIVVAGYSRIGSNDDFALIRLDATGLLDTSFGTGGIVTTAVSTSGDFAYSVALQPDGKIVVGGYSDTGANDDFAVVRYNADGSLDTTFGGGDGIVTTDFPSGDAEAYSVAIQADGKIVLAGHADGNGLDFAIVRYNANGTVDAGFGTGGIVMIALSDFSDGAEHVLIQPDGKIVVTGDLFTGTASNVAVLRLNTDGSLDTSFDLDGIATIDAPGSDDSGSEAALQPDGKIVVAGQSTIGNGNFAVIRLGGPCTPEINLKGGSPPVSIQNGDLVPSLDNHTIFGSVNVVSGTIVRTFTIENIGTATLTFSPPTIGGTHAGDFSVTGTAPTSPLASGDSTTFQVTFDPSAAGIRLATVSIINDDGNETPYTFGILGTGTNIAQTASVTNSPVTYTGSAQAAAVTCSGLGEAFDIKYTPGPGTPINAGTYAVTADCPAATGYDAGNDLPAGDFVISQATPTATSFPVNATYDTLPHGGTGNCSHGLTPVYNYMPGPGAPVAAGTTSYTTTCGDSDVNFTTVTSASADIEIAPATSTVVVTGSSTFTYNASPQGPDTSTVTGSTGAVTYSYEGVAPTAYPASAVKPTNAGTYQAVATVAADANYGGAVSPAFAFEIAPATSTIVVTGSSTFTYNASPQGPDTSTVTGSTGAVTYSYEGVAPTAYPASAVKPTNAGTYQAVAAVAADANYGGAVSPAFAFEIAPAASTIVVTGSSTFTYNASPQGPDTSTVTGSTGAVTYSYEGVAPTAYPASAVKPTNAGTYQAVAAVAADANYGGAVSPAFAFEIAPATSTIVVTGSSTFTYNASPQGPDTSTVTGSTGAVTYSYEGVAPTAYPASAVKPTNAGTYQAVAAVAADANYGGAVSPAFAFEIAPATSTVVVTGSSTFTYNASPQGPDTSTVTGSTGAVTYSYEGVAPTAYPASAVKPTNAGTYQAVAAVAADANYSGAVSPAFAFEIAPAASTIVVTGSSTFTYNASPQGPDTSTVTGSTGAVTYSYEGVAPTAYPASAVKPTNAGTYQAVAAVAADANYGGAVSPAFAFEIAPATSTVVVTGSSTFTYNASPQGPDTSTVTGSTGAVTYSYEGVAPTAYPASAVKPTNAGTYQAVAAVAADANYSGAVSPAFAFEIAPAASTIVVTGSSTFTYNASPQGPDTSTVTGSTGAVTYSYEGVAPTAYPASAVKPTNAGTYQAVAAVAADANYGGAVSPAFAFEIAPATSTIVVTGSSTFTYNASPQGPDTSTVTGSTGAVTYSYEGVAPTAYPASAVKPTNAGTYQAVAAVAADANYGGAVSPAFAFEIAPATSTIVVTGSSTFTYNASPQGPDTSTVTGSTGAVTYSYEGVAPTAYPASAVKPTNAGTYQAVAAVAADANYSGAVSPAFAFEIAPAASTIVVTGSSTFTYNASPQGPDTSTVTGSTGAVTYSYEGVAPTAYPASAVKPTNAGTYQAVAAVAADANYGGAVSPAFAFEIAPATSTIVVTGSSTFTYNASPQGPDTSTVTGSTGAVTYSYEGVAPTAYPASAVKPTNAGTYQAVAAVAADANYGGAVSPAFAFEIAPATSTIVVTGSSTFTYNASPQGPDTSTVTGSTGAVTYSYEGVAPTAYPASAVKPTNAGTYQAVAAVAADANYSGAVSPAFAFEIAPATSTIVVTGSSTFTYNASPQGPDTSTVTGSTGAVTYSYEGVAPTAYPASAVKPTNAGTYQAVAAVAADANYGGAVSPAFAFEIAPATSTIVVTGSSTFTYNASPQGPDTSTVTGSTGAVTYSYEGVAPTAYPASAVKPTNAGTYQAVAAVAADANYGGAVSPAFAFEIAPATQTASITNSPVVYNGLPQTALVACSGGGTATLASGGTGTNAGSYPATVDCAASSNYAAATGLVPTNGPFIIDPATPTGSITNTPVTYNGSPQTATVACLGGGTATLASGGTGTNAGSYPATVNCAASTNYTAATGLVPTNDPFVINQAADTPSVSNSPQTYTGSAITIAVTCASGGTATAITPPSATNAGPYPVTASCPGNLNYSATSATSAGTFTINPATPTASITNTPVTYTGLEQTALVVCSGGGTATLAGGGTGTNAGSYPATVDCAASANYTAATGLVPTNDPFVIAKATPTATSFPVDATYDTLPHGGTGTCSNSLTPVYNYTPGPGAPVAAGTTSYTTTCGDGDINYATVTSDSANIVIAKANAAIVVTPYDVPYDGLPHTAAVTSITGVNGETGATVGTVDVSNTTHTNAGTYNADTWTFTGTANYNNANGTVTDIIGKAVLTVTAEDKARIYGTANPALTATITGFVNGETLATSGVTGTPSLTTTATQFSPVNGSPYPITAALGSLAAANYSFTFVPGTLTVTQASTTTVITNAAALANPTTIGQAYAVNWTTAAVAPSTGVPTGTVTVTDGTDTCTAAVGAGTCDLISTTFGVKSITATYGGDANMTGSTSAAVPHSVQIAIAGNVKQFGSNANVAGVTITLSGSAAGVTVTDANGNYAFSVPVSGGSYLLTPSGLSKTYEPITRSYTNVTANITNADFTAYDILGAGMNPRNIRVQNTATIAGTPAVVPVMVTSRGNETSFSFSLAYDMAVMGTPTVVCGFDAGGCALTADTSQAGRVGITVAPAAVLAPGLKELLKVTFPTFANTLTSTPVSFGDIPTSRDIRNAEGNPLPALYNTGHVTFTQNTLGLEGDIVDAQGTPAGGDGVLANDVTVISQMVLGNIPGPVLTPNQFQRADVNGNCGNGMIDPGDVTVISQYSLGNLQPLPACGPTVPIAARTEEASRPEDSEGTGGRVIRAVNTTAVAGAAVTVSFVIDSQGDEASASYTITFPQATLMNPQVATGSGVPGGTTVLTNQSQVAQGRIGVLIATPNAYAAGTRQMITVTFNVTAQATAGTYPVGFTNTPVGQNVSAAAGGALLATTYTPGNVVIGPTAAGVEISGRVQTSDGRGLRNATVTITDAEGRRRTATTGSFGSYRFDDIEAGKTYVIAVTSQRHRFAPRVINVTDSLTDIDFAGLE